MSKFFQTIALFLASVPLLSTRSLALGSNDAQSADNRLDSGPVSLRPLNRDIDNLFAAHRSHSSHSSHASHASHASHYSGTGGYATPAAPAASQSLPVQRLYAPVAPPPAPTPAPVAAPRANNLLPDSNRPTSVQSSLPKSVATVVPNLFPDRASVDAQEAKPSAVTLTTAEKLKLQVLRVQIALTRLSLYEGPADGVMNTQTREALEYFQVVKGLPMTGTMTTPTLNALGVPAVN